MLVPGTDEWKEAERIAIQIGCPLFDQLLREGQPISRENYILRNWGKLPEDWEWEAEFEAQIPEPLQDWSHQKLE